MDDKDMRKFGNFVAFLRKEKGITQAELGEAVHVSNKAVSKWERGQGFPDVVNLSALADTLGVSITELLQGERIVAEEISVPSADESICKAVSLAKYQHDMERRGIVIAVICVIAIIAVLFLIDIGGLLFFFMNILPIICAVASLILIGVSIHRKRQAQTWKFMLTVAFVLLAVAFIPFACLCIGFIQIAVGFITF